MQEIYTFCNRNTVKQMAPGMFGRFGKQSKSSPNKADADVRASTSSSASPGLGERAISEKAIRKKLSFARAGAALSRAGHRLTTPRRSPKKLDHLQQLVDEQEDEREQLFSTIFSSPIKPELDRIGKPACVRYIAIFKCGDQVTEQHPCQEHFPAVCLDNGHFVTKKMKKTKICQACQIKETNDMAHAAALESWIQAKPHTSYPTNRHLCVSPQRRREAAAKAWVVRRIEALGPLPASSTSDFHTDGNDNKKSTETVYDFREALKESESVSGEATGPDTRSDRIIGQSPKERLGYFAPAALSVKAYTNSTSRAISGSGMLGASHEGHRSVSASLRPLPPLPTPINFDANAMTDKACASSLHNSIQDDLRSLASTVAEDRNYEGCEVYGTPPMRDDDEQSFTYNGEDDYESTLNSQDDDSLLASDPFMDGDHLGMRVSLSPAERPLPSIPSDAAKRYSTNSAQEQNDLGFSTRSLQYWRDLDIPPTEQHSPTRPRQTPTAPAIPYTSAHPAPPTDPTSSAVVKPLPSFDFGFEQKYSRGKLGYTGRMGQKGAGDDFNHDWKFEYLTRDYCQDETATGNLWENKHGFGYAGLKRHVQKEAARRRHKENDKVKQNEVGEEDENRRRSSPNKRLSEGSSSYSTFRPNNESSVWTKRWIKKTGMLYIAAVPGAAEVDQKSIADLDTIVKNTTETFDGIPWDRTMIGCAL